MPVNLLGLNQMMIEESHIRSAMIGMYRSGATFDQIARVMNRELTRVYEYYRRIL